MVNAWKEPVVWFVPCPLSNTISFSAPGKYIYIWNYDHATHIFTYNGMMTHLLSPDTDFDFLHIRCDLYWWGSDCGIRSVYIVTQSLLWTTLLHIPKLETILIYNPNYHFL